VVIVSNPLNEQIAKLLGIILELERDRDKHQDALENPTSTQLADELIETKRHRLAIEALTREIDLRRQELISLELLMLDNSIKSLQSTMGQVDSSVKSLQATAEQTLRSSMGLERSTKILIFATLLLAVIAVFNTSFDLYQVNPLLGGLDILGSFVVIIYGFWKLMPVLRKKADGQKVVPNLSL